MGYAPAAAACAVRNCELTRTHPPHTRGGMRSRRACAHARLVRHHRAGEAAEHDWGLCPGRASGAGQEETLQQYYGSVRKYLASYLRLVEEGGQVDTLRAAGELILCHAPLHPSPPAISTSYQRDGV